jgi:hypothetical protein
MDHKSPMQHSAVQTAHQARDWRNFSQMALAIAMLAMAALSVLVVWADPYGVRTAGKPGLAPQLVDSNQRYMYPQLVRSGHFDSAVLGTSSSRLLDPARLSLLFGTRFANLAMNAATPWEQTQMMALVRANWQRPATIIWGLDSTWCETDADSPAKRLTARSFPDWLYQPAAPSTWLSLPKLVNMTALELAFRRLAISTGQMGPRMRADGFDEFTPPDATYDAARARFHLYRHRGGSAPASLPPDAAVASESETGKWVFPALGWLEASLQALPAKTRKILLFPPLHVASLPVEGSYELARDAACKGAILALAGRLSASVVDYRILSAVTRDETRFWDPLHYRIDVARMIELDLANASQRGQVASGNAILRHQPPR